MSFSRPRTAPLMLLAFLALPAARVHAAPPPDPTVPTATSLGSIGVRFSETGDVGEIGYWLRADARRGGHATRALVLVSRWALARDGVARLQLRADVENRASRRVAEKAGYTLEGVLRSAHWNPRLGRRQDHAMYSLLPSDVE